MSGKSPLRVLIVGATSAIAGHVAREYARTGAQLFLVARDSTRLQALADELGPSVLGTANGDFDRLETNAAHVERAALVAPPACAARDRPASDVRLHQKACG